MIVLMLTGWVRPLAGIESNNIETFNAFGTLVCAYFILMYTDFLRSNKTRYDVGWWMVGIICF